MNKVTRPQAAHLDAAEYHRLKKIVTDNWISTMDCLETLARIRTEELYLLEYDTWQEFCEKTLKKSKRHVNRLLKSHNLLIEGGHRDIDVPNIVRHNSPEGEKSAAEAAPPASNGPPAKTDAAKPTPPKPEVLDALGYPIPADFHATWARRQEVQKALSHISFLRGMLRTAQEENDVLWRPSAGPESHQTWSDLRISLDKAYAQLGQSMPYAVCLVCHGRDSKMCGMCHGRGLISEFDYKHKFSDFDRKVRESQCRKPTQPT